MKPHTAVQGMRERAVIHEHHAAERRGKHGKEKKKTIVLAHIHTHTASPHLFFL